MNCFCSLKAPECECFTPDKQGVEFQNDLGKEWERKAAKLASTHGLHFMHDPGDGGFYDRDGNRVVGAAWCPRHTYELIAAKFP